MLLAFIVMVNCLSPVTCYRCGDMISKDGVKSQRLVWSYASALQYYHGDVFSVKSSETSLPCGKCYACLLRKRRDLSTRLTHEASMHEDICYVTLTYNNESVPLGLESNPTLCVSHVQKFLKRLRRHLEYCPKLKHDNRDHVSKPIRYYCVGEYGGKTHRPHYHLIIFGWSPSDKVFHRQQGRIVSYRSAQIEKLWTFGFSEVSDVTPYVAKYCARYVTKKLVGDFIPAPDQLPEFTLSSKRNGGIGAPFCDTYSTDFLPRNFVTYRVGDRILKAAVPKYYYNRVRKVNQRLWLRCRDMRIEWLERHPVNSPDKIYDDLCRACDVSRYDELTRKEREVF